uniref:peptidylprolyl isomerase n=1 Tax=Lotharella oceanica TaxID=641309 RepID=A0A7S2XGF2_9EUKA|mmetsp:Transcript_6891/g.13634  ORF Transcript_6891/g.13634 Transcript_6891/m.13634 type:complete len:239 (+) Transcript_6891:1-717(+)
MTTKTLLATIAAAALLFACLAPRSPSSIEASLIAKSPAQARIVRQCSRVSAASRAPAGASAGVSRRGLGFGLLGVGGLLASRGAGAAEVCDSSCETDVDNLPLQTTRTGLKYRDIKVGEGDTPPKAFDVVVHYTLKIETPTGLKPFFSSLEGNGRPLDIRVGTGMVIPGLDEGLATMRKGGVRRLYIPGNLSFPNGVKAKPGSPSVPPNSAIVADVQLIYIPGIDDDLEIVGAGEDEE